VHAFNGRTDVRFGCIRRANAGGMIVMAACYMAYFHY